MADVTTKTYDWADLVKQAEGEKFDEPATIYEFSNGRKFADQNPNNPYAE